MLSAAFQRVQLLPERDVLKDQFVMSAARQGERSDEKQNHLQHATDRAIRRDENQPVWRRMRFWRKTASFRLHRGGWTLPVILLGQPAANAIETSSIYQGRWAQGTEEEPRIVRIRRSC
jgi:hypothetical protein